MLRRLNPAPYGAWLSFGDGGPQVVLCLAPCTESIDALVRSWRSGSSCFSMYLQVCCSSPERFLRGSRGRTLEARPIKVDDLLVTGI